MKGKWFGIAVLLIGASCIVACGSDDEASGSDAVASCNAYCDATVKANCTDASDCKQFECQGGLESAKGACATEMKRYYDCMKAQADVCMQGCTIDLAKCM